jgi:magnesium-transporting ATPase (P-type)
LTDKTGTLTKGVMSIKKLFIAGRVWNLNLDKIVSKKSFSESKPKKRRPDEEVDEDPVADALEKELWDLNHGFKKIE